MSSITIDDLPNELLVLIFQYTEAASKNKKLNYYRRREVKSSLVLVCRRWHEIIEKFLTFGTNTFLEKPRTKIEMEMALSSTRSFKMISFKVLNNFTREFQKYQEFRQKYGEGIEGVRFVLGSQCWTPKNVKSKVTTANISELLDTAHDVEELIIEVEYFGLENFTLPNMNFNFNNLTSLAFIGKGGQESWPFKDHFFDNFQAVNLKKFQFDNFGFGGALVFSSIIESLINFVKNLPEVEDVSIGQIDHYGQATTLDWTPTELTVTQINRFHVTKEFFKSRANKYKKIRFHQMVVGDFDPDHIFAREYDLFFILKEAAETLEELETDLNFQNVPENLVLPKVKRLLWYGPTLSSQAILAIQEKLPNLEETKVITSKRGKQADIIRSDFEKAFPDLKKFEYEFKRYPCFE